MSIWRRLFGKGGSSRRKVKPGATDKCPHCGAKIQIPKKKTPEYVPANVAYIEDWSFNCPRCGKEIHGLFTSEPA